MCLCVLPVEPAVMSAAGTGAGGLIGASGGPQVPGQGGEGVSVDETSPR